MSLQTRARWFRPRIDEAMVGSVMGLLLGAAGLFFEALARAHGRRPRPRGRRRTRCGRRSCACRGGCAAARGRGSAPTPRSTARTSRTTSRQRRTTWASARRSCCWSSRSERGDAVGVVLHAGRRSTRTASSIAVGLDDEVGQPDLRRHPRALGARRAELHALAARGRLNSSTARWAAPTAGSAAVSESIGRTGMRTRYGDSGPAVSDGGHGERHAMLGHRRRRWR